MGRGGGAPRLPIDEALPALLEALERSPCLVIEAPPGAGKSTRIAPALLERVEGKILLLQPRRVAARAVAAGIAAYLGAELGGLVGYQVRFERRCGSETRIEVLSEGILLQRLRADPSLEGVGAVLVDELHERSLNLELLVPMLREVQRLFRPDLALLLLSATIDGATLAAQLAGERFAVEGRRFPLELRYQGGSAQRPLIDRCLEAIETLWHELDAGHLLVFLPGRREIGAVAARCAHPTLPLYGAL
ncbi:MAG: DEAD/DEAH box helicase, partial [Myxococcota bacterium]|nr:DEAD/DEAH box helicase [Myxococcota bacterium]